MYVEIKQGKGRKEQTQYRHGEGKRSDVVVAKGISACVGCAARQFHPPKRQRKKRERAKLPYATKKEGKIYAQSR
jgi:hypothetical protein